ncbi:MDR family MFS transporter [Vagococcus vulneris]|uniref:MFS transporter n=1 Tax=Vagococcus vulneris TaxID=1977869 RepID=A0A429ZMH2_9ENTE|nr:MDR family MFS transporter [Vagococcus vulneris]RST94910.1 MFS transporter [Vagococcus vulneris]
MTKKRETNVKIITACMFIATFMTAVEGTIVSTAMPTIVGTLKGIDIMNWVFSIYLLTNAMMTPIYGKLADKIGRKPIYLLGVLIFIIGSALSGISQNMIQLIIFRAIQGIGAGSIIPVSLTIIADMYPIEKRAGILGLNSAAWGIASILGPLAGGFIVDVVSWHWIFLINVPIGLVLMLLIWLYLIEDDFEVDKSPIDYLGSFLMMVMLLALLYGFQTLSNGLSIVTIVAFIVFIVGFVLFIRTEKRAADPVISLDLFTNKTYVMVNLIGALISGFLMGIEVYIPMWMQGVLGKSAAVGGIVLAPMSVIWMIGSFMGGRAMQKWDNRKVMFISMLPILIGALFLVMIKGSTPYAVFLIFSGILGVGFGMSMTILTVLAQSTIDKHHIGVATSFFTLTRTIGQTLMVSIFGLVLNSSMNRALADKQGLGVTKDMMNQLINPHTANSLPKELMGELHGILASGIHQVFIVGLVLVILAFVLNQFQKRLV